MKSFNCHILARSSLPQIKDKLELLSYIEEGYVFIRLCYVILHIMRNNKPVKIMNSDKANSLNT